MPPNKINKLKLDDVLILFIPLSMYLFNQFSLFDLMGIRVELQIIVITIIISICLPITIKKIKIIKNDIYLIYISLLFLIFYIKGIEESFIYTLVLSMIIYGYICTISYERILKILNTISITVFIFSFSSILLFLIILIFGNEDMSNDLAIFNDAYLNSKVNVFFADGAYGKPQLAVLRILGLGEGGGIEFGPFYLTRIRSFLHESSLIAAYFTFPAAVILSINNRFRYCGYFALIFSFISGAWSSLVLLPLTLVAYIMMSSKNSNIFLKTLILSLIFFIMIWIFVNPGVNYDVSEYFSINDKMASNFYRLRSIAEGINLFLYSPITGINYSFKNPIGYYLLSSVYGGVFILLIYILFARSYLKILHYRYTISKKNNKFGHLLLYGIFLEYTLFNDYGFSSGFGIIMIGISYQLLIKGPKNERNIISDNL